MANRLTQEFYIPATSGTDVVLTGDPVPLPRAVRAGLQLIHVSSALTGSRIKVKMQVTKDGVNWTDAGPSIDRSGGGQLVAPGMALASSSTIMADSTACRLHVTHVTASYASVIRVTIHLQEVR